uniref:Uncharacterized protein n=1 Tax=Piliocolobus tephrosceles TaxID=591936 RepID=A0A8C9H1D5_9PRIM
MPSLAGPPFGAEATGSGYPGPLDLRRPLRPVPGPPFTDFGTSGRPPAKLLPAAAAIAAPSTASTTAPFPPARLPLCAPLPPRPTTTTTSVIFLTDRPV